MTDLGRLFLKWDISIKPLLSGLKKSLGKVDRKNIFAKRERAHQVNKTLWNMTKVHMNSETEAACTGISGVVCHLSIYISRLFLMWLLSVWTSFLSFLLSLGFFFFCWLEWLNEWIKEWINDNLSKRVNVNNWKDIFTCRERQISFLLWSVMKYIIRCRTGLMFKSSTNI